MKSVLVTGGSGYIGTHTIYCLLDKGYKVYSIDSLVNSNKLSIKNVLKAFSIKHKNIDNNIKEFFGDIRNEDFLRKVFKYALKDSNPIIGVIHLAGLKSVSESVLQPQEYWENNVYGTMKLLQIMKEFECKTIVFSSSASIYGSNESKLISENSPIRPVNPYAKTKSVVESFLEDIFYGLPNEYRIVNLRYFNPIGAHDSGFFGEDPLGVPNNIFPIINRVATKEIEYLKIYGNDWPTIDGTGIRDYVHVMDLAEGHIRSLEFSLAEKPRILSLNIGTGKGTSVLQLKDIFENVNKKYIPYKFVSRRAGDVARLVADNSLATKYLNWKPSRTIEKMCIDGWRWQKFHIKK